MSEINEIIDGLIFIKDGTKDMSERQTINKACDILAKVKRGELVESVRCGDCNRRDKTADLSNTVLCKWLHNITMPKDGFCNYGERSGENENDGRSKQGA